MTDKVKLTIDRMQAEVPSDYTIMMAAKTVGIDIQDKLESSKVWGSSRINSLKHSCQFPGIRESVLPDEESGCNHYHPRNKSKRN